MMRAMVQAEYGEPRQVLRPAGLQIPQAGQGQVLLRVRAAGVDRGAWHLTTGLPYPVRLAGYGVRRPKDPVRGRELAGVVERVGQGVTGFAVGDEVFGIAEGCFAEYVAADVAKLAHRPDGVSAEQAAALPISGTTALQAVRDAGRVAAGERVLVLGASGGVGHLAVQVAKAFGAHVTGVCSAAKADLVRSLGADEVLDYRVTDVTGPGTAGQEYDVVVDTGGNRTLAALRRILATGGRLVLVGGENGGRWLGGFDRQLRAPVVARLTRSTMVALMASETAEDLTVLAGLAASGAVVPAVERSFPLEQAGDAIAHVAAGRARGKVVVTPA